MAERVSRRLILLSSAAIGAVYLAGYLDTRSADAGLGTAADMTPSGGLDAPPTTGPAIAQAQAAAPAQATAPTSVETTTSSATTTSTSAATGSPAAGPTAVTSSPAAARPPERVATPAGPPATATAKPAPTAVPLPTATAVASGLRDGTYTGIGDSRRGAIQVALTIKGGRISNVTITGASTQYPVSWISDLPAEVVASQSAQVDLVSGATYSSLAFQGAVRQALAQAQA
jgi:uncharacterized protein with FMN-binding domain